MNEPRESGTVGVGVVSFHNSKETKAICNAVAALGHEPVWFGRTNLASRVADGSVTVDPSVDVAINRLLTTKSTTPLCQLSLAGVVADAVPTLNPPEAVAAMLHKYRAAARLARAGVPVPDTVLAPERTAPDDWSAVVGETAVRKPGIGTNGTGVDRVTVDEFVGHHETGFLVQRFHGSRGEQHSDVRVYVVDGEVVGAMRRTAPPGEWRSNVALGGETEDVTGRLPASACEMAIRAAAVLELDIAGVDLIQQTAPDSDTETDDGLPPEWAVLEVNATAGFKGLFEATGVSAAPYVARAAVERAGGEVADAAVERLATELDDSLPACAPDDVLVGDDGLAGVVGYTTELTVAGTTDATTTTAKVDTGADRTAVDFEIAEAVGAGPVSGTATVRVGDGTVARPLAPVSIRIGTEWFDVEVGLTDRSANTHPVLLGRDVLGRFRIDPTIDDGRETATDEE